MYFSAPEFYSNMNLKVVIYICVCVYAYIYISFVCMCMFIVVEAYVYSMWRLFHREVSSLLFPDSIFVLVFIFVSVTGVSVCVGGAY